MFGIFSKYQSGTTRKGNKCPQTEEDCCVYLLHSNLALRKFSFYCVIAFLRSKFGGIISNTTDPANCKSPRHDFSSANVSGHRLWFFIQFLFPIFIAKEAVWTAETNLEIKKCHVGCVSAVNEVKTTQSQIVSTEISIYFPRFLWSSL